MRGANRRGNVLLPRFGVVPVSRFGWFLYRMGDLLVSLVVVAIVGVGTAGVFVAWRAGDRPQVVANGLAIALAFLLPLAFDRRFPYDHRTSFEQWRDRTLLFFGRAP